MLAVESIEKLQKRFKPDAAKNVSATFLFNITGAGGGSWLAKIDKGSCQFTQQDMSGPRVASDCTISVSSEDLELITSGKLNAMTAALSGVLCIDGELGLAMQLVPIFFEGQANIL